MRSDKLVLLISVAMSKGRRVTLGDIFVRARKLGAHVKQIARGLFQANGEKTDRDVIP